MAQAQSKLALVGRKLTLTQISALINGFLKTPDFASFEPINRTRLHRILKGLTPTPKEVLLLSHALFGPAKLPTDLEMFDLPEEREWFLLAAEQARTAEKAEKEDPFEAIVEKSERAIRVGVVEYGQISGPPNAFVNRLLDRFAAFACLNGNGGERIEKSKNLVDIPRLLCNEELIDLAIGIFATPDRCRDMAFLHLPILIPVNGVALIPKRMVTKKCQQLKLKGDDAIPTAITLLRQELLELLIARTELSELQFRPIVNSMEVGGQHVRNFLGMTDRNQFAESMYDPSVFLETARNQRLTDNTIAMCVADEYMCIHILDQARKNPKEDEIPTLVEIGTESSMPRYWVSLAMNRERSKWKDYLTNVLELYMDSNAELLVKQYGRLYRELNDANQSAEIRERISLWFGLNKFSPDQFLRSTSPCFLWYSIFHHQATSMQ
jgi:hypothetical protein